MRGYSDEEAAWLAENWPRVSNRALAAAFSERFGREVTVEAMRSYGGNRGLRKLPGTQRTFWTGERAEWLRFFAPGHTEPEISAEHERLFGEPLTDHQIAHGKKLLGVKSGTHGGRFEKGNVPANKGKSWDDFMTPEAQKRCRAVQFKPGNMPQNARPIGTEREDKDGYVWVKVRPRKANPRSAHDNWEPKHRMAWERAMGRKVPEGCMVVFADHDMGNFDPGNLVLMTMAEHQVITRRRMDYWDAPSCLLAIASADLLMKANGKVSDDGRARETLPMDGRTPWEGRP